MIYPTDRRVRRLTSETTTLCAALLIFVTVACTEEVADLKKLILTDAALELRSYPISLEHQLCCTVPIVLYPGHGIVHRRVVYFRRSQSLNEVESF